MPKRLAKLDVPNEAVLNALKWVRRYLKTSTFPSSHYITIFTEQFWTLHLYTHNNVIGADLYDMSNNVFTLIKWDLEDLSEDDDYE